MTYRYCSLHFTSTMEIMTELVSNLSKVTSRNQHHAEYSVTPVVVLCQDLCLTTTSFSQKMLPKQLKNMTISLCLKDNCEMCLLCKSWERYINKWGSIVQIYSPQKARQLAITEERHTHPVRMWTVIATEVGHPHPGPQSDTVPSDHLEVHIWTNGCSLL